MKNKTLDLPAAGVGRVGIGATRGLGKSLRILSLGFLVALTVAAQKCDSETLFKSNFDATAFNQPPSTTQAVGTATFFGVPGSVLVVPAPPDASPPAKWLRIMQPNNPQLSHFHGRLKRRPGNGTYVFSTALVIPDGNTGPASISFENFNFEGFLQLDFMPNSSVRVTDQQITTFGTFARNQVFLVQVTLIISDTSVKARIVLSGAGASGQADRSITAVPLVFRAREFEEVTLSVDSPGLGTFHATNIVVSRKT